METYMNVLKYIWKQLDAEVKVVQIIHTGIDNDIYSIVDACLNACEMWKAIERSGIRSNFCTWQKDQEVTPDVADNSGPVFDAEPLQNLVEIILFIFDSRFHEVIRCCDNSGPSFDAETLQTPCRGISITLDSGCSKHMTRNLKLLSNFVEQFLAEESKTYTWTYFLRSKDETQKVLIDFLKLVQRGLHAQGGSPAGIHGLFSERYCGLAGRMVTLRVSTIGAKRVSIRDDKKDVRKSG
ncbi:hypothetical protein Tco_0786245 [Tanacetum coccineum]